VQNIQFHSGPSELKRTLMCVCLYGVEGMKRNEMRSVLRMNISESGISSSKKIMDDLNSHCLHHSR
jgi:hypothetical protein